LQYAVVEVINSSTNEAIVFPVASNWLTNLKTAFDDDGKYFTSAIINYPANDDKLHEMLLKRPDSEHDHNDEWLQDSGCVLKFCRKLLLMIKFVHFGAAG